jgi:hypothetical protein
MPFGLTNAHATFQQYINDVLREFLDLFVVCYLDDIIIYSQDPLEHTAHVRMVLQKLQEVRLFINGGKCAFNQQKTNSLGFIVGNDEISMDPAKVEAVQKWKSPKTVRNLQQFLGFTNFYQWFIKDYSQLCKPF